MNTNALGTCVTYYLLLLCLTSVANAGCGEVTRTIYAGQNNIAGTVTFEFEPSSGEVCFDITTANGWKITTLHLQVGTTNFGKNPAPGQFTYNSGATSVTEVSLCVEPDQDVDCDGTELLIYVHADMKNMISGKSETGWASGLPFGGKRWGMDRSFEITC